MLWDVDLTLEPGDMVAVVGASGVGKSTFLHILGTLDLPTSGSIKFDGEELTHDERRRGSPSSATAGSASSSSSTTCCRSSPRSRT